MKQRLSERIRPNSEAAPWVIAEIKKLEGAAMTPETKAKIVETRQIRPSEIMGVLQNPWFKPSTPDKIIQKYRHDVDFRRYILGNSMTGQRLVRAFGEAYDEMWWDNANPEHATVASGKMEPDPAHLAVVIRRVEPRLIICFGRNAESGVLSALKTLARRQWEAITVWYHPHPNARFLPQSSLNNLAREALTFQVPLEDTPVV